MADFVANAKAPMHSWIFLDLAEVKSTIGTRGEATMTKRRRAQLRFGYSRRVPTKLAEEFRFKNKHLFIPFRFTRIPSCPSVIQKANNLHT